MADTNEAGAATKDSVVTKINKATTLAEVLRIYKDAGGERGRGGDFAEGAIGLFAAIDTKITALIKNQDPSNITDDVLQQMQELGGIFAKAANSLKIKRIEKYLEVLRDTIKTKEKKLEEHLQKEYKKNHPGSDAATWESPEYKEWAGRYDDDEEIKRLRAEIFSINREITQLENQQKSLMLSSQQKSAPQQHQEDSESPRIITVDNVFEHAKKEDLSTWTAEEMRTLLITLNKGQRTFNGARYDTKALRAKLEKAVVKFSQDFYDNKLVILNMDDAYIWQDVINYCAEQPKSEYGSKNVEAVRKAKDKVAEQINGFEEEFGLDKDQSSEQFAINLKELEKLPDTSDLFAHRTLDYPVQPATENFGDIRAIVATYRQNGRVPELSVLVGALQNDELGRSDQGPLLKKQLVQLAVERIKLTTELKTAEAIGNFDKLLSLIPHEGNEGLIESKRQLVTTAKEFHEQDLPLEHSELQEAYNLLNALEIQGELGTFGRRKLSKTEQEEHKYMIIQRVRAETEAYLANVCPITNEDGTKKELTEVFYQEFSDRLNLAIMEIVYADEILKSKKNSKEIKEDYATRLENLVKASQNSGAPIKISTMSLAGWHAARNGRLECSFKKLNKKYPDNRNIFHKISEKIRKIDERCTEKFKKPYIIAKTLLKAHAWGFAFGAAASIAGPAGVAVVATVSFALQARGLYTDIRNKRDKLAAQGQKLTFWNYVKNNKMRIASVVLSATGVVASVWGVVLAVQAKNLEDAGRIAEASANLANVNKYRFHGMLALGASGALNSAMEAYQRAKGSKAQKLWSAAKAFAFSGVAFAGGFLSGRAGGEAAGDVFSGDSTPQDTQLSSVSQDNNGVPANGNEDLGFGYKSPFSQFLGQDGAEASDVRPPLAPEPPAPEISEIDPNNLTQEQQHDVDMMIKRAPKLVWDLLGDGKEHSSAELQRMWDSGEITDEQKISIAEKGGEIFDNRGRFINPDGSINHKEENAAVEWQRQHDAATKTAPEPTPEPEPKLTPKEQEGVLNGIDDIKLSGLGGKISPLSQDELDLSKGETSNTTPSAESQNEEGINVTKVKTNENDVKIVYRDADGHRHVHHTDSETLDTQGLDKIKFNDGEVKIKITTTEDGKFEISPSDIRAEAADVVVDTIVENRGLEGVEKITLQHYNKSEFEILEGDNGWARVDESGVDTLVKNEDGSFTFSTGAGEHAKPMTYAEAKEFAGDLQEGWQTSRTTHGLHAKDMLVALYQNYSEEYAVEISEKLDVSGDVKVEYNAETGITSVSSDNGVTFTDKSGWTYSATANDHRIQFKGGSALNPGMDYNDTELTNDTISTLKEIAMKDPDSPIAQAFAARDAEIQLQQDLADRGLEGAEPITGYLKNDPSRTTFYNNENGCALIGEDGKMSTLVVQNGKYTFTNGNGEEMSFEEAREFGRRISDFYAPSESGFIQKFNDIIQLNTALYQHDQKAYAENISDQLGIGGKISPELQEDGSTHVVGENGVSITTKDGLSIAAVKRSDGSIEFKASLLEQKIPSRDIDDPNWVNKLKTLAIIGGNDEIADAITAKQAEAPQQVGDASINEPYGLDMEKAQIYSDTSGSIFVETQDDHNNTIKFEINSDGEIVDYSVNDKSYSSDELAIINNKDTLNQQLYSRLEDFAQPMPENDPSQTQVSEPSKLYSPEVTKNTDETLHVVGENGKGETVEFSINKDGEYTSYKVGNTEYTQDELDIINHDLELNKIAYSDLQAEISLPQLQQDLADRGLEGAEPITGYLKNDPSRTTFYNNENGCALIGEDGKMSTLVEQNGEYTFTDGNGEKMSFEEAREFGRRISDFYAPSESGFIQNFKNIQLNTALYQHDPKAYAENISDQLGIGGKISPELQEDGSTHVVGENGVSIITKDGLSIAAVKRSDGSIEFKASLLEQKIPSRDIYDPNLVNKLKTLATIGGNDEIADAITAKQAEAPQQVGDNGRPEADKTPTPLAKGDGRAENVAAHLRTIRSKGM